MAATKRVATKGATKKSAARKTATKTTASQRLKDPRGGLTAAGRRKFAETEGAKLRPGVRGAADTPEKMRRKGSFLRRHFANPRGPMVDEDGQPTRLALSAHAWGEPVPKTAAAARKLAAKGEQLLERYHATQAKGGAARRAPGKRAGGKRAAGKRAAGKRTAAKRGTTGVTTRASSTRAATKRAPAKRARS